MGPEAVSDRHRLLPGVGQAWAPLRQCLVKTRLLWLFSLLAVVSIVPVLSVRIPAMADYPNHLARMFVIARSGSSAAQPFYRVNWALYPNLAMDIVVPSLGRLIGVEGATRLFLLASDLLIVSGAVAIELAVKRRFELSGFVAVLALYSLPFAWGFLNFEFALGLALWTVAGWLFLGERAPVRRFALHSIAVIVLFVAHLFALGIYGFVLGVHELWWARRQETSLPKVANRAVVLSAPVLPVLFAMTTSGASVGQDGTTWSLESKPLWIFAILNGDSLVIALIGAAVLCFGIAVLNRRRAFRFEECGAWLLVGFVLLYVAMPFKLFDTAFVDMRVVVAALLIMPAFLSITYPDSRWRMAVPAVLAGVACLNAATAFLTWTSYATDYGKMIEAFGQIEKGSNILIGDRGDAPDPPLTRLWDYPMYNAPTLAVHYADAFVPTLFTSVGKQVVTVDAAHRRLAVPYGGPVPGRLLAAIAGGQALAGTPSFVKSWTHDFDYLCLVGEGASNPLPTLLSRVAGGQRFTLYRIIKSDLRLRPPADGN